MSAAFGVSLTGNGPTYTATKDYDVDFSNSEVIADASISVSIKANPQAPSLEKTFARFGLLGSLAYSSAAAFGCFYAPESCPATLAGAR